MYINYQIIETGEMVIGSRLDHLEFIVYNSTSYINCTTWLSPFHIEIKRKLVNFAYFTIPFEGLKSIYEIRY